MKKTKSKKAASKPTKQVIKLLKIDTGIKVPELAPAKPSAQTSAVIETMKALKVGQSFLIRDPYEAILGTKKLHDFMGREKENGGKRVFIARKMNNGTRFFRTA